jgi:DNA repair protein RadC
MQKRTQEKIKKLSQEKKIRLYKKLKEKIVFVSEEIQDFKKTVRSQKEVLEYFRSIAPYDNETVFVLYLDAKNGVIDYKQEFSGTLSQSVVYTREIIKKALDKGASSVILVHNHPSGNPTPSEADRKTTKKLAFACQHMDMALLDHIIIGAGEQYYSFYEQGLIERLNGEFRSLMEGM